jgi:nucleotide-binding universal stress UspA family protein
MLPIRTVQCSVDFSAVTARQMRIAAGLCRTFGARLILHHNIFEVARGSGVGWMSAAAHPPESTDFVERTLESLASECPDVVVESHITRGGLAESVLALGDAMAADLVVLSVHGGSSEESLEDDHVSLTEQVLERGKRDVLVLHATDAAEGDVLFDADGQRRVALVPTDLSTASRAAMDLASELARRLPLELHVLHLVARGTGKHGSVSDAKEGLAGLVAKDLADRTVLHVEDGEVVPGIVRAAERLDASCIVMGEHTRAPIRRWFARRNTSRAVLRQAPCPVWYVPGRVA